VRAPALESCFIAPAAHAPRYALHRAPPVETDPVTGEKKTLGLDEKEKLYLDCLDAFYNEGGKQLLGDEEYEALKLDLDFDGSKVATYTRDEIKFVIAVKCVRSAPIVPRRAHAPWRAPSWRTHAVRAAAAAVRAAATFQRQPLRARRGPHFTPHCARCRRFKMGKGIMSDSEYDELRTKLTAAGSLVVMHDGASCSVDTGLCKTDMRIDTGKT
jgi:hypothetical protein